MLLLAVFVLLQILNFTPTETIYFTAPPSASGIQGESVDITWTANLTELPQNTQMTGCKVIQKQADNSVDNMIAYSTITSTSLVFSKFQSREADLKLTYDQTGIVVTCVFTMNNLNRTTDAKRYVFRVDHPFFGANAPTETVLDVLDAETIYFTGPSSASGIQGESVNITWTANITELPQNTQMTGCRVFQKQADNTVDNMIAYSTATGTSLVFSKFQSREADLKLTFSQNGIIVTCVFSMNNLNRTTDAKRYVFRVVHPFYGANAPTETVLDVLVPTVLTSPNPHYITVNESDTAQLVCTATGDPKPNINWTGHGVLVGTGVYTTDIVGIHDDKTCNYTCIAYNGVHGAKTANVCLNVQFFKEKRMGQFEIMNLKWQDELKDSKSTAYKNLKNQCMKILKAAYENIAYVVEMNVNAFVKGSVIVLFQLDIINRVPDPLLPLKTLIKDNGGEINGLTIALESVQESKDFKEEPIPNNNNNKTVIAVLGALFAVSLVMNIILIIFAIWLRRKESIDKLIKRSVNNDEIGNMNDITLQETSFISTNNITGNSVQEYEPVGSLGLAPSSAEIPGYEAVSTVTQPTQQPSGVQSTTNSTTKNEVVDRQREKNCEGNKPDRTGQSQGHKEQLPTNAPSLYQTILSQSSTYSSLSPLTKLPAKNTKPSTPKINGEYQTIQKKEVPPQYQSLDDLGRC